MQRAFSFSLMGCEIVVALFTINMRAKLIPRWLDSFCILVDLDVSSVGEGEDESSGLATGIKPGSEPVQLSLFQRPQIRFFDQVTIRMI